MASAHHTKDSGTRNYNFRYIRSRKIRFSVKAQRDAAICLSPVDNMDPDMYQIFIGCWGGGQSGIRRGKDNDVVRVDTPAILSANEFRNFWISIKRGTIKVGKRGKRRPFMSYRESGKLANIRFYGYSTGYGAQGDWKFGDENDDSDTSGWDSEEEFDNKDKRPIKYKLPMWVPGHGGFIPRHPVTGGKGSGGQVYVGMAKHEGGQILGMVVPSQKICYIPFGGKSIPKRDYYMLSNPSDVSLMWKEASGGTVPTGAIEGGKSEKGENLYVGRVTVGNVVSVGKVHPSHGVCYVSHGNAEQSHRAYEVLCIAALPCRIRF